MRKISCFIIAFVITSIVNAVALKINQQSVSWNVVYDCLKDAFNFSTKAGLTLLFIDMCAFITFLLITFKIIKKRE